MYSQKWHITGPGHLQAFINGTSFNSPIRKHGQKLRMIESIRSIESITKLSEKNLPPGLEPIDKSFSFLFWEPITFNNFMDEILYQGDWADIQNILSDSTETIPSGRSIIGYSVSPDGTGRPIFDDDQIGKSPRFIDLLLSQSGPQSGDRNDIAREKFFRRFRGDDH